MRQVQSIHSVAFAMAISLTLFDCSDSSSGDDNEVSSSSSELNEESSSSSEDLSSSSEAESSSSEAESSSSEVSSSSIAYGTLDDKRDGKTYRTVVIGAQVWMAENLNYTPESGNSWCYMDETVNCTTYGRLYDWATANSVCPSGWHLPSNDEWTTLIGNTGGASTAGTQLKANSSLWNINTGTDDYGFSALPGGNGESSGYFNSVGGNGFWWSATEGSAGNTYYRFLSQNAEVVISDEINKDGYLFSVRCVRD